MLRVFCVKETVCQLTINHINTGQNASQLSKGLRSISAELGYPGNQMLHNLVISNANASLYYYIFMKK